MSIRFGLYDGAELEQLTGYASPMRLSHVICHATDGHPASSYPPHLPDLQNTLFVGSVRIGMSSQQGIDF